MIDRFAKFSSGISELSRYWHKLATDVMEEHGLKGPHAVYLTTMYTYPEGITAAKLVEQTARDKGDVSRAIAQFQKQGLVEKEGDGPHNYRAALHLTERGREIAKCIIDKASTAVEFGGKGLSDAEREIFYQALDIICANLRTLSEEGLSNER